MLLQNIEDCKGRDAVCTKKNVTDEILTKNMQNLGKCSGKTLYYTRNVTKRSYHACCNFNLEPAEIQSKKELNCITQHFSKIPGGGADIKLYTAYWDATFTRKFESCLTRRTLPDELWSKGEPNNKLNVEYCAVLRPCASCEYAGFDDVECTEMLPMLCQMNSGDVIQEETSLLEQTTTTIEITTQFASTSVSNATSVKIVNRYGAPYSTVSKSIMTTFIGCNKKMESCKVPKNFTLDAEGFIERKAARFDVWTSVVDSTLSRNFVSCLSGFKVPQDIWAANEPDNKNNLEACAYAAFCPVCNPSKVGYHDTVCANLVYPALCQNFMAKCKYEQELMVTELGLQSQTRHCHENSYLVSPMPNTTVNLESTNQNATGTYSPNFNTTIGSSYD
ncbi:hypothetical protein B566_EDAN017384 [Ephemera danica]|nr:hypothetical protein B566_EDAN017384 [Ephemera danica]